jgi:hypothetical protein
MFSSKTTIEYEIQGYWISIFNIQNLSNDYKYPLQSLRSTLTADVNILFRKTIKQNVVYHVHMSARD